MELSDTADTNDTKYQVFSGTSNTQCAEAARLNSSVKPAAAGGLDWYL